MEASVPDEGPVRFWYLDKLTVTNKPARFFAASSDFSLKRGYFISLSLAFPPLKHK